jgi:hypothetical protein
MSGGVTERHHSSSIVVKYDCGCTASVSTVGPNLRATHKCDKHSTGFPIDEFQSAAITSALKANKMSVHQLVDILEHPEFSELIEPLKKKAGEKQRNDYIEKMEKKRAYVAKYLADSYPPKKPKTDE